jgi:NAD(P)-dependent dehydrogenase (short-subunit alcohol dehydrogenase family)
MKSVAITGSTRGIGYALADSFLERGCSVTISGRKAGASISYMSRAKLFLRFLSSPFSKRDLFDGS